MECKTCKWYALYVNPETGRKMPTQKGKCEFPLAWPEIWPQYAAEYPPRKPDNHVWPGEGWKCQTYKPIGQHGDQQPLI